jgi:hypothetical protein
LSCVVHRRRIVGFLICDLRTTAPFFEGEGFPTSTDARHCVNGISLRYEPTAAQPDDIKGVPGFQ